MKIFYCKPSILTACILSQAVFLLFTSCSGDYPPEKISSSTRVNQIPALVHENAEVVAAEAPEWAEMLKQDSGWIGADGIYCVPLNGVEAPGKASNTETLFWFSDDVWGTVKGDTIQDGWEMAHNAIGYMQGSVPGKGKMKFYQAKDSEGHTVSVFEPHTPDTKPGDYYWLGDGFFDHAKDSTIYIFAYRIRNVPGGIYPFDDVGVSLIAIPKGSKPPFRDQRQVDAPLFFKDSRGRGKVVFGSSVLANTKGGDGPASGWIYLCVWGKRSAKRIDCRQSA